MKAAGERVAVRMRAMGQPWELGVFLWLPCVLFAIVVAGDVHFRGSSLGTGRSSARPRARRCTATHRSLPPCGPRSPTTTASSTRRSLRSLSLRSPSCPTWREGCSRPVALGCVLLALRLLGVRDWRCYGLALLTAPVLDMVSLGALSSAMLLGVAAAWGYRDRPYVSAPVTALTAVAKLFAWPLFVWLLATRRLRTFVAAGAVAVVLLVGGWGSDRLRRFAGGPPLAARALARGGGAELLARRAAAARRRGATTALTAGLVVAVVVAVLLAARGPQGDRRSFAVAVVGALLATPVLWLHYLVLLFVPIALARPRFSALWFAPLAFWVTPIAHSNGSVWRTCFALAVTAVIVLWSLVPASAAAARRPGLAAVRRVLPAP